MKLYHFNLGDSCNGPIGFSAGIRAKSKRDAVCRLAKILEEHAETVEVVILGTARRSGEYVNIYFNNGALSVMNIDAIIDSTG